MCVLLGRSPCMLRELVCAGLISPLQKRHCSSSQGPVWVAAGCSGAGAPQASGCAGWIATPENRAGVGAGAVSLVQGKALLHELGCSWGAPGKTEQLSQGREATADVGAAKGS